MPSSPEKQRQSRADRYDAYKRHCSSESITPDWPRWSQHYAQIRQEQLREPRLTREQHFAFWRERLTDREIRDIGNSLDFLLSSPFEPTLMVGVKVA